MNKFKFPFGNFLNLACTSAAVLSAVCATAAEPTEKPIANRTVPPDDGKLRIICFGAHPDDCELQASGVGALWAQANAYVNLSTLGLDRAATVLGVQTEVLDNHDGELMPTLENREKIIRLIREWKADLVISPRPNDYHPDHRYTGVLVQDAAYMVAVPFICPDVPPLKGNPVFMFYTDRFQKPTPSQPDVAISIDSVIDKKLDALAVMESQFFEGGALGSAQLIPSDPAKRLERVKQVREGQSAWFKSAADRFRNNLVEWYGKEQAEKVRYSEAFEICEYGRRPDKTELKRLFPFFGE